MGFGVLRARSWVCGSVSRAEEDTVVCLIRTLCWRHGVVMAMGDAATYSRHSPDFKQHPPIFQAHYHIM
jgi:hypothetical protein